MNVIGRTAISLKGRDKGRTFIIVGVLDEDYVAVANGELRKIEKPKKKKLKHLWIDVNENVELADLIGQNKLTNGIAANVTASYHTNKPIIKKE